MYGLLILLAKGGYKPLLRLKTDGERLSVSTRLATVLLDKRGGALDDASKARPLSASLIRRAIAMLKASQEALKAWEHLTRAVEYYQQGRRHGVSALALLACAMLVGAFAPFSNPLNQQLFVAMIVTCGAACCVSLAYCGASAEFFLEALDGWGSMRSCRSSLEAAFGPFEGSLAWALLREHACPDPERVPLVLWPWRPPYE